MTRFYTRASLLMLFTLISLISFGQTDSDSTTYQSMDSLGMDKYSISLNVADISKSLDFYQKLGFEPMEGMGSVEDKWMILSNGSVKLGLFQGFFPSNTITFNPTNGREVYKRVTENGIEPTFQLGMDKESGPCTFSLLDPDGNPILIDQH